MAGWLLKDGTYVQTIGKDVPPTDDAVRVSHRPEPYYDYVDGAWTVNTEREYAYLADDVRAERAEKLQDVDQIAGNALRWAELTAEQQNAWSQYRTDLLNITDQAGFPHNVIWPTKP